MQPSLYATRLEQDDGILKNRLEIISPNLQSFPKKFANPVEDWPKSDGVCVEEENMIIIICSKFNRR
jgi:hypothetical protein